MVELCFSVKIFEQFQLIIRRINFNYLCYLNLYWHLCFEDDVLNARRNNEKKNASRNCSRELHRQFTFFFLKSSILAIKPFPSKIVHSASIPLPPLTVLLNHLAIIVRRRSFFFPTLDRTFVKETRYHESPRARLGDSSAMIRKIDRRE